MIKYNYLLLFLTLFLFACKKEQLLNDNPGKTVDLKIQGYVMADTLEFVLNDKIIGYAIDNSFNFKGSLYNTTDKIQIRKKADHKIIGDIELAETPFNQVKKIFYDGTTIADNVVITPVTDVKNMGCRLRFSTSFIDFYGGPVDIEFYELYIDYDLWEFIYTPLSTVKNITGGFGDFIELPPLADGGAYYFKVYKAGTKELPYTKDDNVIIPDPANNYGQITFTAGESFLYSITPLSSVSDGKMQIGPGYEVQDFSSAFK